MGTGFEPGPSGLVDNALAFETMGTGFDPPRGPSGLVDNALAFETMGTGFEPRVRASSLTEKCSFISTNTVACSLSYSAVYFGYSVIDARH
ncbi:unnamed protein product [Trichobilharzia regenti]|nr:unnamed protein product [Trichobilharzia regenti]